MSLNESANAYLRTKVMSASQEELRLLLLDGALKFANQAKVGLETNDFEQAFAGFTQCRDIILELIRTIDPKHNPELAETVSSLYTFMYTELIEASHEKDVPRVGKVIELLEYERETWVMLMEKIAAERSGTAPAEQSVDQPEPAPKQQPIAAPIPIARPAANNPYGAPPPQRAPISIQA